MLLQLGVFGFGLLKDGHVGVGVFPKGEEVLVLGSRFCGVNLDRIRPRQPEMRYSLLTVFSRTLPPLEALFGTSPSSGVSLS